MPIEHTPIQPSPPKQLLAAVTRKSREITELVEKEPANLEGIKVLYNDYLIKVETLYSDCGEQHVEWLDKHNIEINKFRRYVDNLIHPTISSPAQPPTKSVLSVKSAQSAKSQSSCASGTSARVKIAQKRAKAISTKLALEKSVKLETEELKLKAVHEENLLRLQNEKKLIECEQDITEANLLERQLNDLDGDNQSQDCGSNEGSIIEPIACKVSEQSTPYNKVSPNLIDKISEVLVKQNEISTAMIRNQERSNLPKKDLQVFNGLDITKFKPFLTNFRRIIADNCDDDADKFIYLRQFTSGKARTLVNSCNHYDATTGYRKAMKLLQEEYGNEFKIASCYLNRLHDWPQIKSDDVEELEKLCIFLVDCYNYLEHMTLINQLQSPEEMMKIIRKLPYKFRERWQRHTFELVREYGNIWFKDLVEFVQKETKILQQPFFCQLTEYKPSAPKQQSYTNKNISTVSEDSKSTGKFCEYCKKFNHFITSCKFFLEKTYAERVSYVKRAFLCFACLRKNHYSKQCQNRMKCSTCNRLHPTLLHNPNHEFTDIQSSQRIENTSCSAKVIPIENRQKIQFPTLPVKVSVNNGKNSVIINCVLDSCSSDCWISENLMRKLGVKFKETTMNVSTLEGKSKITNTKVIHNLTISDLYDNESISLPTVYSKPIDLWPFNKSDALGSSDIENYSYLDKVPFNFVNENIELLIGINIPELFKPLEIVSGELNQPFASKLLLGWTLNGPLNSNNSKNHSDCHFIKTDKLLTEYVDTLFSQDFIEENNCDSSLSQNDKKFISIVESSIEMVNNHYQIDLPLKTNSYFPNNKKQIFHLFTKLIKQFDKEENLFKEYSLFMNNMIEQGFVEKVPISEIQSTNNIWYIPHHAVRHKKKKKLRIVFNCSQRFAGISLNDNLYQGPDLANNLFGVLTRFREEKIALTADVEQMYYQVRVPTKHADLLRFFWLDDDRSVVEYRLRVHVFGATSSPSVANFALRRSAIDSTSASQEAKECILKNFYVDDLLMSGKSENKVKEVSDEIIQILKESSFKLKGYISNSELVLKNILKSPDKIYEIAQVESRVLGVIWNTQTDQLGFKVNIDLNLPVTKRNVLSILASIYDPLGVASPALVEAKKIFQEANRLKIHWDDHLSKDLIDRWLKWVNGIKELELYLINRCFVSANTCIKYEIHTFVDGSNTAYGAVTYVRIFYANKSISVSLIASKSRLTPINNKTLKTTPRIELCSAKLGVQLFEKISNELTYHIEEYYFWTDSTIVLQYIKNEERRFLRFVSNKVCFILSKTNSQNWYYVPTSENPADLVSRGVKAGNLKDSNLWNNGPKFLYEENFPEQTFKLDLPEDAEIKTLASKSDQMKEIKTPLDTLMESVSDWYKLKVRVAWLLKFKNALKYKTKLKNTKLTVQNIRDAEIVIIRYLQSKHYSEVFKCINLNKPLPKSSSILKLTPVINNDILRVGGRIEKSSCTFNIKHPIILPGNSSIVALLVEYIHSSFGHLGREFVLSYLRKNYWITKGNALVRKIINKCIACRKRQGKHTIEIMGNLPKERLIGDIPAFQNVGVDCYGPFYITHGRKQEKRYGAIFSCLSSRAIHLEIVFTLSTDSFICALRRFIARRGNVKSITCDNGTNFVAGCKELKLAIRDWNNSVTENYLKQKDIEWHFNPPLGSHHGGIYEREIRSVRHVLYSLVTEQNLKFTDETLATLMCEIEAILNNRPLTEITSDPSDTEALTPNHLLLFNAGVTFPPGLFQSDDLYLNKRWKQVQYLVDLFWHRWRKEYMVLLQQRQKWQQSSFTHQEGDLVLVVDALLPRNQWLLGRIFKVKSDNQNKVRRVLVKICKNKNFNLTEFNTTIIERPITKLILLRSVDCL